MGSCQHKDFEARVEVNRFAKSDDDPTIIGYNAEIKVWCVECLEDFVFVGAPVGMMPSKPCIDPLGTELRVPLRPQSADPHFGLGLAGFEARVRAGLPQTEN